MHGEPVNGVHTAVRCQMCVLERTLRNGKNIFIKILRNDIRMSCTEPGLSRNTCWVQIHSVGFLTPKREVSALSSSLYRKPYSAFSVVQRWAVRSSYFIQKTSRAFLVWIICSRWESNESIHSSFHFSFTSYYEWSHHHYSRGFWCQPLFSLLMHSLLYRLTCFQGLFEYLTQQCFTCNKTKGGFTFFCTWGWKYNFVLNFEVN